MNQITEAYCYVYYNILNVPCLRAGREKGTVALNNRNGERLEVSFFAPSRQKQRPYQDEQREHLRTHYLPPKGRLQGFVKLFYQRTY